MWPPFNVQPGMEKKILELDTRSSASNFGLASFSWHPMKKYFSQKYPPKKTE